ncbi:MAG: phosphoenolpyruvate--protein phosphotransferase [Candidatus Omnitrophica bacterium]|nr:phosphoenolpyruvate--protein phosphotransferase [Candidatus Omnitrophota bacterium]
MKHDNAKLISDIGELTALFTDAAHLDALLQNIVNKIAAHMNADTCSIYLFNDETQMLTLKATKGLRAGSIGKVCLKPGEGLTGISFKERRTVCEGDAARNPGYRPVPGVGEEKYCSFLAIPILRGQTRIGVMTIQSVKKNYFSDEDINIFNAITSQLTSTIEMVKLLSSFAHAQAGQIVEAKPTRLKFIQGRGGSEGLAIGDSVVIVPLSLESFKVPKGSKASGIDDFRRAVAQAEKELHEIERAGEERQIGMVALIFSAQIMMLKDRAILGAMETLIGKGMPPEDAVCTVIQEYVTRFDLMANEYVREKRYDVLDVGRRILVNMAGRVDALDQYAGKVVIVRELLPTSVLKLSLQGVAGIVLLSGGVTSHMTILARSLHIPLVIVNESRLLTVKNGTRILLDGLTGYVCIDPDEAVIRAYRDKQASSADVKRIQREMTDQSRTKDGVRVVLLSNINLLADLATARAFKSEGVGLYRSEFPFLLRGDFPSEEEQYVIYRRLVHDMKGREITFRTLDVGGDKMLSYYDYSKEANPFLGLRSIRFSLKHRDIFIHQLRAILRAGFDADIRIMFPMISSVEEFVLARDLVRESARGLKAEGVAHQASPFIGAMIEVPSILEVIDELAAEADFFSIGTNDLIQYMLAVDRTNEKVAEFYFPHHPAVLRAMKRVADAALRHQRDISVCGDMAHDPRYISFLLGIGIRKLSLDARHLPRIQQCIAAVDTRQAELFAARILKKTNVNEIARMLDADVLEKVSIKLVTGMAKK